MSQLEVNDEEHIVLREVLESARKTLLLEDASADARDYRLILLHKMDVIERLLSKLRRTAPAFV
jgi:hypothetical protein